MNLKDSGDEMKFLVIFSILLIFGIIPVYADENLRTKLEESKDILTYTTFALNYDSYLIKNYVRDDLEFLNKIISNCAVGTFLLHHTVSECTSPSAWLPKITVAAWSG